MLMATVARSSYIQRTAGFVAFERKGVSRYVQKTLMLTGRQPTPV